MVGVGNESLVALVLSTVTEPPQGITIAPLHKSFVGEGATIAKAVEVTEVKPVLVNVMVAPETAAALVAVKSVKVVVPETAAFEVVPPIVQVPAPTVATTVAVLAVAFPYWSWTAKMGCVAKTAPFVVGAAGCVNIANLAADPAPIACETEALL